MWIRVEVPVPNLYMIGIEKLGTEWKLYPISDQMVAYLIFAAL